jgi:hypothetical protein
VVSLRSIGRVLGSRRTRTGPGRAFAGR